jgi:hypothetical protein
LLQLLLLPPKLLQLLTQAKLMLTTQQKQPAPMRLTRLQTQMLRPCGAAAAAPPDSPKQQQV